MTDDQLNQLARIPLDTRLTLTDPATGKAESINLGWLIHSAVVEIRRIQDQITILQSMVR